MAYSRKEFGCDLLKYLANDQEKKMKSALLACLIIIIVAPAIISPTRVAAKQEQLAGSITALCPPGVYLTPPNNCLPLGPSSFLTDMARLGLTIPAKPIPVKKPDPELAFLPYYYAKLQDQSAMIYSSSEDAIADQSPVGSVSWGEGFKFISYSDIVDNNGDNKPEAFYLRNGGWVSSRDVQTRWGATPKFQGLEITEPPEHSFGWVIPVNATIESKRTPSYKTQDLTGRIYDAYQVIPIYNAVNAEGMDWFMVGPDEWVEGRQVARVVNNPIPPQGVTNGRWIEVNLFEQTMTVYDQGKMIFATMIASGIKPYYTRPGLFQIFNKKESTLMSGAFESDRSDFYYLEDVPWTIYYDEARALHGAYWRAKMGYPQSHGCVNLTPGDSHWLFNWANVGDLVYVWDPSGETPTDPKAYTQGGA